MSFSFKSVKDFFVKTRKSQISEHDKTKQSLLIEIEWEKIQEAAKEGFGFFLGYAKRHFDESKYKEILLNINEIGRFIEKENTFCLLNHSNTEIIYNSIFIYGKSSKVIKCITFNDTDNIIHKYKIYKLLAVNHPLK